MPAKLGKLRKQRVRLKRQLAQTRAKQRQANKQVSKPLYQPGQILAGAPLRSAAQQITDADYAPKFAALNQQANTTNSQYLQPGGLLDRQAAYSRGLDSQNADLSAHQLALGKMLQDAQAQVGQRASTAYDQAAAQEVARASADAGARGPGLGGGASPEVAAALAGARVVSTQQQQAAENQGAAQTANYAGLQETIRGAQQLHGQETNTQLLNRLANSQAKFAQDRATLRATKGDDYTKTLLGLRQDQAQNLYTQLGLGIKKDQITANTQAQAQDYQAALARIRAATKQNNARIKSAKTIANKRLKTQADIAAGAQQTSAENSKRSAATQTANNKRTTATSRANAQARIDAQKNNPGKMSAPAQALRSAVDNISAQAQRLASGATGSKGQIRDMVSKELQRQARKAQQVLPDVALSSALDLALDGHVSKRNIRRLRDVNGVKIPAAWRPDRFGPRLPHG